MRDVIDFCVSRFKDDEREVWSKLHSDSARREFLRVFLKEDFRSLVYLLGYKTLGAFHDKEVNALSQVRVLDDHTIIRKLWLWSRGFFKTTLITECHSVYLILNNPDIRILLASNTINVAEAMMGNIKGHFMVNVAFRHFFPEYCPTTNTVGKIEFGTNKDFTIPCRTKILKEPTVMVAGVGTNLTGMHFDYMKLDDLVTKDSVTNDTQIQASKDYYSSLRPLFDSAALPREDVIGTIYHFNDLYYSTLRPSKLFEESYIPARIDGKPVFPERLSDEQLDELVVDPSVGPYTFATQYMLNPINPADAKFREEWIKYYDSLPEGLSEYILVDPASKKKKKSDYSVLERWGVDHEGVQYLLEGFRDKMTAFERIDKLFEMVGRSKNLKVVKYEALGGRYGDLEEIERRQMAAAQKAAVDRKAYRRFTVKETKGDTAAKEDRITQRLVSQYHAGMVRWPQNCYYLSKYDGKVLDFVQILKLEYLQFPFSEHDDALDCQAHLFDEGPIIKGLKPKDEVPMNRMSAENWDKMYAEVARWGRRYPHLSSGELQSKIASNKLGRKLNKIKMGL